jgi:hypothetical protein
MGLIVRDIGQALPAVRMAPGTHQKQGKTGLSAYMGRPFITTGTGFIGQALQAYNAGMNHALRPLIAAAFAALPLAAALAQAPAQNAAPPAPAEVQAPSGRPDKAIQRIRTEDAGTRIDELRVGGETQQITVQPKTGGAAYEVKPAEGARGAAPAATNSDTNGSRVWNVLKF